ncbi:MAG: CUB domain-containing protein, partial [Bacteroidota bacterium]
MIKRLLFVSICCLLLSPSWGQGIYQMSNATVSACRGTLYDSSNGTTLGHYAHLENFTFTICVQDSAQIFFEFNSFCTELDFDTLRIFDGPDTLSAQIGGVFSGTQIPPPIVSSSNCLTIHFASDANISCTGWQARWTSSQGDPPTANPIHIPNDQLSCGSNQVQIEFTDPVPCDSITTEHFV